MPMCAADAQGVAHEHCIRIKRHIGEIRPAGDLHLPAAVVRKIACLCRIVAECGEGTEDERFVVYGKNPAAVAHDLRDTPVQPLVGFVRQAHRDRIIADRQFFHDVEYEIGHLVCDIAAVTVGTGENDILVMLRVPGAGRRVGLDPFAAFDEEVGEDFTRFIQRDYAAFQILFQRRSEHFVNSADPRPVAAQPCEREREPQTLHGFPEGPRCIKRDTTEHRGDFRIVVPLRRQIPCVPDPHGVDHPAQVPLHGAGTVRINVVENAVHTDFQHTVKSDRHVAHRPQYILTAERDRYDMRDRSAKGRRAADLLTRNQTQRRVACNGIDGMRIPFHTVHFRKSRHIVHGKRSVRHCVVTVHTVHGTIGKRARLL